MEPEISTPHDKLFKQFLGEPENAASFLAGNLDPELVSHLDLKNLQVLQASFIDAQFVQSEADLLFSVTIAGRPGYVYFLFEHQSSPDLFMMLRLLAYMVRVWQRFLQDHPGRRQLPVILPMVLFHGPRSWQGPLTFQRLVDIPEQGFKPFTPDFQCNLYDLSPFGADRLVGNALVRIIGDLLGAHGYPDFKKRVRRALEALNELGNAPGFARYLEICFRYILQVFDIPKEDLRRLVSGTIQQDVEEFLMTTYEQLKQEGRVEGLQEGRVEGLQEGRVEGLQEGRVEGLQEGACRVLIRLLTKKFQADPDILMPFLSKITTEQHDELAEKILDSRKLEEILDWLESVCRN